MKSIFARVRLPLNADGTHHKIDCYTSQGQVAQTLAGLDAGVKSVSFSPDGQVLASSDFLDQVIPFWILDFRFWILDCEKVIDSAF
jgi:WD40 repeat protein